MNAPLSRMLFFGWIAIVPAWLTACTVPVFRYALDHWRPDAYQVLIYHDQDFSEEDESLLSEIRQAVDAGANLQVRTLDVRKQLDSQEQFRLDQVGPAKLPRMLVQLPPRMGDGEVMVDAAPWNETEVRGLLASPVRQELSQRLIRGEMVWVLLESGDRSDDDARYRLLTDELAQLQETLELAEIDPADQDDLSLGSDELSIQFSTIRISRDDPHERWLVEMLLSVEPDLRDEEIASLPMVFPIFGRGRALYSLVGDGINPTMLKAAAIFLTGGCQCTVKAENPGVDLLLSVRWDDFIDTPEPEAFELPLAGLAVHLPVDDHVDAPEVAEEQSETAGIPSSTRPAVVEGSSALRYLPWAVVLALGVVMLAAGAMVLRRSEAN